MPEVKGGQYAQTTFNHRYGDGNCGVDGGVTGGGGEAVLDGVGVAVHLDHGVVVDLGVHRFINDCCNPFTYKIPFRFEQKC